MRILGIDYGEARIGIAASDIMGTLAGPVCTISTRGLSRQLEKVMEEVKRIAPDEIVVGLPRNMDGSEGKSAESARAFATELGGLCGIEIKFVDERLTTVSAHRALNELDVKGSGKRKKVVDTIAAVILLQTYLDKPIANRS